VALLLPAAAETKTIEKHFKVSKCMVKLSLEIFFAVGKEKELHRQTIFITQKA